ncbi:ADAMTS-like protein 5 isoform 1-T2 [Clarias gariepinus]|uniref:ADAMTS-like protein 5 n=1 Tax=Clarias gariepinus TaxID=13013 RepID=UPI00234CB460|nr:ADAMTS-like protein 5 [Clarias gariepinus]XP_053348466.1 ADAMTS-like protein 5 [Clarias gariepinus]
MPKQHCRKLSLFQALTLVMLLTSPDCQSSQRIQGRRVTRSSRVPRQLFYKNEWASWGVWSECSRSCGGGASIRRRTCIYSNPVGGPCLGEPRQYKICNTKGCPPGSLDFRELQCKAFDDKPLVAGSRYQWTTFHGGSDPCELSCLALGHNFYYNFGRVLDGTPCLTEPGDVCVSGKCLKPGCDLIFGSQQQEDACMVCGGQNTTCLHHRSVYRSNGQEIGPFGYNEVTMIPAGATHIRVTDNSKNYLALQNGHSQFVINGNWKISVPGEYSVAGTKLLYRRSADTFESFEVSGPTQEDLHIMVLFTDKNSGIEYEYWLPPELYAVHHGRQSTYRHHHTSNFLPWELPTTTTTTTTITTTARPPATTRPSWGRRRPPVRPPFQQQPLPRLERDEKSNYLPRTHNTAYCGKCRRVKGRGERQRQYCQKDYVFRAKILGKVYVGEETRYDVQIIHTYRNRFRLERREYIWAPNRCDCPALEEGYQYVLMVRRHVNHEHTLDRILLEEDNYVQLYRPREDSLLRPLEDRCSNRGPRTH